jgi:DNA-binding MarR family transcriptional regulator
MNSTRIPASTDRGEAMTELILETFRLNGQLLASGDELVADIGLTSARWQVLGAIAASAVPLPVAGIARNMGLSRQAVQRLANEMQDDGLLGFAPNPHHERARLVVMTKRGEAVYRAAMERQRPWARALARQIESKDIAVAVRVMRTLRRLLDPPRRNS